MRAPKYGFGFLERVAGIPIGESLISYNPAEDTYGRALINFPGDRSNP